MNVHAKTEQMHYCMHSGTFLSLFLKYCFSASDPPCDVGAASLQICTLLFRYVLFYLGSVSYPGREFVCTDLSRLVSCLYSNF